MVDLVILVVSVAAIDSLNPSTIVPALFLISEQRPYRAVTGFAAGVFAVNLAAGVVALVVGQRIAKKRRSSRTQASTRSTRPKRSLSALWRSPPRTSSGTDGGS